MFAKETYKWKRNLLHLFTADCGAGEMLAFNTSPDFINNPDVVLYDFSLYPKVVTDVFKLEVFTNMISHIFLIISISPRFLSMVN